MGSTNNILIAKNIKTNKKYKIIFFIILLLTILIFFSSHKVYAANAKVSVTPTNPRVGDTITVKAEITGNDCYSIHFTNLDESTNLEYISMDSQKKASGTTPLTGSIQAKYRVKSAGDAWISLKLKIESAKLKDKKLDLDNIVSNIVDKKIDIKIVPAATNVEEMEAKFEVTDNDVNIRPHPSTTYSVLGVYSKGKVINVTGKAGEWYQFTYENSEAYMHKDYLKEIKEENEVVEEPKKEVIELDDQEEEREEIKDPKVKDPRDQKDNTMALIIVALLIGGGILAALIYLFKQGKDDDNDLKYGKQKDDEKKRSWDR